MDGPAHYLHFGFILISLDKRVKMRQETVELSHPQIPEWRMSSAVFSGSAISAVRSCILKFVNNRFSQLPL